MERAKNVFIDDLLLLLVLDTRTVMLPKETFSYYSTPSYWRLRRLLHLSCPEAERSINESILVI